MNDPATAPLLSRLLAIVRRSFPQYVKYSRPYVPPGREELMETIDSIVVDQDVLAQRIGNMLIDMQAPLRSGEFPMEYTDMHDLSIDYLIASAVDYQQQDITAIQQIAEQLQMAPAAKALAEEALGMAKGHLDSLQELIPEQAGA